MEKKSPTLKRVTPSPDLDSSVPITFVVSTDGSLDISHLGVSKISERQLKNSVDSAKVLSINLSHNKFVSLDFLKLFTNCHTVDASNNQLKRLLYFAFLKRTLKHLNVSHNRITDVERFLSFMTQLDFLDLSFNSLSVFPSINDLQKLSILDLSNNQITHLPPLKSLLNLKTLKMNSNNVTTLNTLSNALPTSLITFEIAENQIQDLTEVSYLKNLPNLVQFSFHGNPAVGEVQKYNYRPYIVSKQLNIEAIDGSTVSDDERLVAEHLHIHKKISPLVPGEGKHALLVSLLEAESPKDESLVLTPKMMAVRHEFLMNKSMDLSNTTPGRDVGAVQMVSNHIADESTVILPPMKFSRYSVSNIFSTDEMSGSSNSTVVMSESLSQILDLQCPIIADQRMDRADSAPTMETFTAISTPSPMKEPEAPPTTKLQFVNQQSPTQSWTKIIKEPPLSSRVHEKTEGEEDLVNQSTDVMNRSFSHLPGISSNSRNLMNGTEYAEMKAEIQELKAVNNKLINEMNELKKKMNAVGQPMNHLQLLLPMPTDLRISKFNKSLVLKWKTAVPVQPVITSFAAYIDGKYIGTIPGNSISATINGNLQPGQVIGLEAISPMGVHSVRAEYVYEPNDDKENVFAEVLPASSRTV
uniref:Leucine rich repeat protein n=1 Tax=Panagrolaimus sp. JU765 TaxID=591449 RepID=A0AC34RK44_9BILA